MAQIKLYGMATEVADLGAAEEVATFTPCLGFGRIYVVLGPFSEGWNIEGYLVLWPKYIDIY